MGLANFMVTCLSPVGLLSSLPLLEHLFEGLRLADRGASATTSSWSGVDSLTLCSDRLVALRGSLLALLRRTKVRSGASAPQSPGARWAEPGSRELARVDTLQLRRFGGEVLPGFLPGESRFWGSPSSRSCVTLRGPRALNQTWFRIRSFTLISLFSSGLQSFRKGSLISAGARQAWSKAVLKERSNWSCTSSKRGGLFSGRGRLHSRSLDKSPPQRRRSFSVTTICSRRLPGTGGLPLVPGDTGSIRVVRTRYGMCSLLPALSAGVLTVHRTPPSF
mmetsp:Transcript_44399/g.80425  ORF Transcript_44399/g.80425 Transcript_44399/m.80425 type:complete len:277 (-) Transcript_44399:605-1435(-)